MPLLTQLLLMYTLEGSMPDDGSTVRVHASHVGKLESVLAHLKSEPADGRSLSLSLSFSPLPLPSLFSFFPSFSLSIIKKFKNLNQKKQTCTLRCDIIFSLDICLVIISVTNFHQQLSFYLFLVKI